MTSRPFDFIGARGRRLSGVLETPEGAVRGYALFAHCFTCTKNSLAAARIARALAALGIGVLRFDFTGLGQSEGDFAETTFSGDIADLVRAAEAMADEGVAPALLIGHSLGGAAVLAAAGDLPGIRAIATLGAPFDVTHVTGQFGADLSEILDKGEAQVNLGGRPFTVRREFVEDLARHDQAARIAALHRPLLILHAPRDAVVGIDNAQAIFLAARHPKSFVSLDEADHLLTRPADAAYAAEVIAAWASRYLPHAAPLAETTSDGGVQVSETRAGKFQVAVAAGGAHFFADEPAADGGLGSGPSPYELVSAGLGACTAMTLRLYADQKGWPLGRVTVQVSHAKIEGATPADHFTRLIALEGPLDEAQRDRLIEIAGRCPVHRTLERGSAVETRERTSASPDVAGDADDHFEAMCAVCEASE